MGQVRRNTIDTRDARLVGLIAAISAIAAGFSGVEPTGEPVADALLAGSVAALATWLGASAPWWALTFAAAVALGGSIGGPVLLTFVSAAAIGAACWIGYTKANQPALRAGVAGVAVQVLFQLSWDPRFLSSAGAALLAGGLVVVTGYRRRRGYVRKRIRWGALAVVVTMVAAVGALAAAAYEAARPAKDGYDTLLDALDHMDGGDVDQAAQALWQASLELATAHDELSAPLAQPARFVPVVAQNRSAAADAVGRAAEASAAAATALEAVDLDDLTISGGRIDLEALASLEEPLAALDIAVGDLSGALNDASESPWLVAPFQSRLDEGIERAGDTARQAETLALAAAVGPDMLGADEPRNYFVAFVNAAESRGQSGLMGNWIVISIDDGAIEITDSGRTADLQTEALDDLVLDISDEYLERYGQFGAATPSGGVDRKYWSTVNVSPDMPSVGDVMEQMYEAVSGDDIDGVFIIDARGLAHLLAITGSIGLDELDLRLGPESLEQFLVIDQYQIEEAEREVVLETVIALTMNNVLSGELPEPQEMIASLAPGAQNGHISAWSTHPAEQALLEQVGMDGSLPVPTIGGVDSLAVTSNNMAGNKIDSFLERTIEYRPRVDQATGRVDSTVTVTLTNTAPRSGLPDYVIGAIAEIPKGTNRTLVELFTPLDLIDATVGGGATAPQVGSELAHNVYSQQIDIAAGDTVVLEYELSGGIGRGEYRLAYRPQPLPRPDRLIIDATTTAGDLLFDYDGTIERRSVISSDGVEAWR
ncbi:MAG: DUF4012 domain-containing protein [Acidimicrobiia bacterium]|nr:DUF4012 domain-containing protein [Acidimicrobiia bacterium]